MNQTFKNSDTELGEETERKNKISEMKGHYIYLKVYESI